MPTQIWKGWFILHRDDIKDSFPQGCSTIFYSHFQGSVELKAAQEVLCSVGSKQNLKASVCMLSSFFLSLLFLPILYFHTSNLSIPLPSCSKTVHPPPPPPPPFNPFSLHLSSGSWFIMPVIQWRRHRAVESSMPFTGHQRRLCLRGTLLPAGLWMLVAISTLKFDCCREMKAISYRTPRGVQKWIFLLLFTACLICLFKDWWTPI